MARRRVIASPPDHPAGEVDAWSRARRRGGSSRIRPRRATGATSDAGDGVARSVSIPRSALLSGGLAVVLAIGAFALAFGSGSAGGGVGVEGGLPLSSDPSVGREPGRATWSVDWQGTRRRDRRRGRPSRCLPPAAGGEGR